MNEELAEGMNEEKEDRVESQSGKTEEGQGVCTSEEEAGQKRARTSAIKNN